jgi:hypothetical protein
LTGEFFYLVNLFLPGGFFYLVNLLRLGLGVEQKSVVLRLSLAELHLDVRQNNDVTERTEKHLK